MGFFSRNKSRLENLAHSIKSIFGEPKGEVAHRSLINPNQAHFSLLGAVFKDWVDNAYKRNEVVAGSLNLIINTFLEAPLKVRDPNTKEILDNTDIGKVFKHINDNQTQREFFKELLFHLYLGSVSFIEKVKTNSGKLTEIGLLRPDKVMIKTNNYGIEYFEYYPATKPILVEPEHITFLRFADPTDKFKGHSPLFSCATRIDTENERTELMKAALENGGVPGTIIRFAGFRSDEEKRSAGIAFTNRFKGDKNGSVLAIDEDVQEISPFGSSIKDIDGTALMNIDEARILSTLGIPLPVYGSISGQSSSTYDNMRTSMRMFWMHTIIPLQTMIEDFLNNDKDFSANGTLELFFDRSHIDALKQDYSAKSTIIQSEYNNGVRTLNEAREAIDLELVSEGDQFKQVGFSNPEESDEKSSNEELDAKLDNIKDQLNERLDEINNTLSSNDVESNKSAPVQSEEVKEGQDSLPHETSTFHRDVNYELKVASKRLARADSAALPILRMVDAELNQQIKDVIELIGDKEGKALKNFERARLEAGLNDLRQQWEIRLAAESLEEIGSLIEDSADTALAELNVQFAIVETTRVEAAKAETYKFANKVSKTSADQINKIITSSFEEGKSLGELSKEIRALGKEWTKSRSMMIARTETVKAANEGARLGYLQGGVTKMMYSAILDDVTTEICRSLDGKIVGIGDKFLTAEEGFTLSNGKPMNLSYNDGVPNAGTAHPNCRSVIIPIID